MNKFKLALFAVIAAGAVGCGGAGGGSNPADAAVGAAGGAVGTGIGAVTDTTSAVVGAGDQAQTDVVQAVTDTHPSKTVTPVVDSANVVVDNGKVLRTQVFESNTQSFDRGAGTEYAYKTLTVLAYDLNRDGANDVIKFRSQSNYNKLFIEAHINNGDGTHFTDESHKYFGSIGQQNPWVHDAYLVDLNADGREDIVMFQDNCFDNGYGDAAKYQICTTPLYQQADGSFAINTNPLLQTATDGWLLPGDFDGDGDIDLLHRNLMADNNAEYPDYPGRWGGADHDRNEMTVFENRSENGVGKFVEHYDIFKGTPTGVGDLHGAFTSGTQVIDINGDGLLDVLVGGARWGAADPNVEGSWFTQSVGNMSAYINNGDMTFTYSLDSWLDGEATCFVCYRSHVADFDGDGDMDMAVATTGPDYDPFPGSSNHILWNSNGKMYKDEGNTNTHDYMGFTHMSDIGDIDNDGDIDIIWWDLGGDDVKAGGSSTQVRILKNNGSGGFTSEVKNLHPRGVSLTRWVAYWTMGIRLADMNGNGYLDIIVGEDSEFGRDRIVFNNGNGTFNFGTGEYLFNK